MKKAPILNKSIIAAAVAIACAQSAMAQQAAESIQRVEITGSSIKRTNTEAAGSVTTMNRADIERLGATTALDILKSVAAVGEGSNSATASSGSFAPGSSSVDMRALGKVSTLVLVNGRRIAPYGLAESAQENFTNLDAIAAESIERIEILKDGASAIYGSDAIAGVVNLILRKEYTGVKLKTSYTAMDGFDDYRKRNASILAGWGDIDKNGFNTYVALEGYKTDGWSRGEVRSLVPAWHRLTPGRSTWDAKSTFSPTGNYFLSSTNIVAAPGCPADAIDPTDKLCKLDVLPYTGDATFNDRWALTSNTHFRIGSSIDANFEITAAGAKTDYIVAPFSASNGSTTSSTSVWYNAIEGKMVGPFSYPKLPVGHPSNPYSTPVEYRARLMDTGNGFNFNSTDSKQSRFMLALTGQIGDYDWKSAAGYMSSNATKATRAVSAKGYTNAIVNKTYKFGQTNDTELLESMFPVRTTKGDAKIAFIDGTITGEVAQLPAGPLSIAVGADLRRMSYAMASSDNVLRGDLVGIFGLQVDDSMTQGAVFTEATIPVFKKLELNAALRADKTNTSDAHVTPKLGLRFNATDNLLLRATAAGGFRAPNIIETGNGLGRSSVSNNVNDLKRCPTATALNNIVQNAPGATTADKQLANTYRNNECLASLPSFVKSNPDLKPETSKSLTVGMVWEPIKNTVFTLDFFSIERKDEIGTRTVVDVLKAEDSLKPGTLVRIDSTAQDNEFIALAKKYGNTTATFPVGKLGLVYNPYVNSGKTRAKGFDFEASTRQKLGALGDLTLKLDGVYNWNFQSFNVGDNTYGPNQYGTYDSFLNMGVGGRLNANVMAVLKTGVMTNGVTVHYAGNYSNNSEDSPTYCVTQKVAAENMAACETVKPPVTMDYNFSYTGIKNVKLSLYVNNVFNKEQAVKWRYGWDYQNPGLRTYGFAASYEFK
ncbi:TonB-dependent receptor [Pseudoduganella ginsengisoli]|nr:TonB-dependent receptor [Pseudoduganella ginsengisoli]